MPSHSDEGIGAQIESGEADLKSLEASMLEQGEIEPLASGRQEYLENVVNDYIWKVARSR